jgi:uroporphyrinogen decarboxylase
MPVLQALRGDLTPRVPFWLMRQAGRYLPEYRALRQAAGSFLALCQTPKLAAEVTLQPLRRFDMDAAIIFSDILVVPQALGQALDFAEGEGPRLGPLDLARLHLDPERLSPACEALQLVRQELRADKALIGFAGAPWTLACYMIQGRGDGIFAAARDFARQRPGDFDALIALLTETVTEYLSRQISHGADAVQLFDSWAGLLAGPGLEMDFARWVIEPARRVISVLRARHPGVPVIGFPRGAGALYALYAEATGVDGIGLDQHMPIEQAVRGFNKTPCLQGNLDPAALLSGGDALRSGVRAVLDAAHRRPLVFNLGHGIVKETPPEHVAELAALVRGFRR